MKVLSRVSPWSVVTLLLSSAIALSACEQEVAEEAPVIRPVKAIKVDDYSALNKRHFSGRAKATQELDLSFRVPGNLVELPVNVGDQVEAGGLVSQLDPATFKAEVDGSEASVARAAATLENATAQRQRDKTLFDKGHVAQARLDKAIAAESEAKADLRGTRAALNKAKLNLTYTTLTAPFAGVIVTTYVDNFQDVRAKEPVVRLLDKSKIEMVIDIPENLIGLVPGVTEVVVEFDPFPGRKFAAEIKEIGAEASATTRTYPVTLILDQPDDIIILPGMAGRASGSGQPLPGQENRVTIPIAATFSPKEADGTFVWIFDEASGVVQRRAVTPGALTEIGVQIEDGIEPGEWVVTAGVSYLREGQQVRLLEE